MAVALALRERVDVEPQQLFRLVGVGLGLSNFIDPEYLPPQPILFDLDVIL